jgi:hypothetical protein
MNGEGRIAEGLRDCQEDGGIHRQAARHDGIDGQLFGGNGTRFECLRKIPENLHFFLAPFGMPRYIDEVFSTVLGNLFPGMWI